MQSATKQIEWISKERNRIKFKDEEGVMKKLREREAGLHTAIHQIDSALMNHQAYRDETMKLYQDLVVEISKLYNKILPESEMDRIEHEVDKALDVDIDIESSQLDLMEKEYTGMCRHIGEEPVLVDQHSRTPDKYSAEDARIEWLKAAISRREEEARSKDVQSDTEEVVDTELQAWKQEMRDLIAKSPTPEHELQWQDHEDFAGGEVIDRGSKSPSHDADPDDTSSRAGPVAETTEEPHDMESQSTGNGSRSASPPIPVARDVKAGPKRNGKRSKKDAKPGRKTTSGVVKKPKKSKSAPKSGTRTGLRSQTGKK